jgi:hypothetical protein
MLLVIFWVVSPYSLVGGYQRLGATYLLLFQGMFLQNVDSLKKKLLYISVQYNPSITSSTTSCTGLSSVAPPQI